jgi:ADP-ribose pyrophosphatase YjhB (NUDIX family)
MNLLEIARELQAISQAGLHFTTDPYDTERFERIGRIAAELLSGHSRLAPEVFLSWNEREFGFPTPKVDVRGVIAREEGVLLISELADSGRWTLPGGWADVNESPAEAVVREVQEETGFVCRAVKLLGVLDREKQRHHPPFPYHVYKLFFHCEIIGGAPQANLESSELGFFKMDQLPELSLGRTRPEQIRRFVEKIRSGDGCADFE